MDIIKPTQDASDQRTTSVWRLRRRNVVIDRPFVVGILNITPDSFSDGGLFDSVSAALAQAKRMVDEGADAIDVGGESTRPQGAKQISAAEEIDRVLPVVRDVRRGFPDLPISVDTTKSAVAAAALGEGADIVNDVSGLRLDPRIGEVAAAAGAGVVLMHSRGSVEEMGTYRHADYTGDIVDDVVQELKQSVLRARALGVDHESLVVDPGIGFAKRSAHSLRILAELDRFDVLGCPIMVGVSRKRFIGEFSGVTHARDRVAGSVGANVAALMRGATLFRVHDVAPNRQALDVAWAVLRARGGTAERVVDVTKQPGSRFPVPGSQQE